MHDGRIPKVSSKVTIFFCAVAAFFVPNVRRGTPLSPPMQLAAIEDLWISGAKKTAQGCGKT
jgi:hypothetical protein